MMICDVSAWKRFAGEIEIPAIEIVFVPSFATD